MHNSALNILKKIEEEGYKAYIVGGYVRDYLLGQKSLDVDICTNATPKELKNIFKNVILPNEQYGSITLLYNKIRFEITTFRKEKKYINHRSPSKIKYIDNLSDDIIRRDFTINTICIDSDNNIIDMLDGKKDIEKKLVKMVGNPRIRLKEDSLRILRAVRFATTLDFEIDSILKKYIIKYGYLLTKLSYHRKKEELDKIFSSPNAKKGITLLKELQLDKHLELDLENLVTTSSSVGIWSQLDVLDKYPFSNNERETIIKINQLLDKNLLDNRILYKYGLYIVTIVGEIRGYERKYILEKYDKLYIKSRKDIVISSLEICQILNLKTGPILKIIINDIESKLLDEKIENTKESITNYLTNNYKKENL